jgi:hypothetical protein
MEESIAVHCVFDFLALIDIVAHDELGRALWSSLRVEALTMNFRGPEDSLQRVSSPRKAPATSPKIQLHLRFFSP